MQIATTAFVVVLLGGAANALDWTDFKSCTAECVAAMPDDFQARVNLDECSVGTGDAHGNYNFFTDNKCFCHKGEYEGSCNNKNSN
eukprot:gene26435-32253_t